MDLSSQRRMAAEVMHCGINRVWLDPTKPEDIAGAVTRGDVRMLIKDGLIRKKPVAGVSRGRARKRHDQKRVRRRVGQGSRKGGKFARFPRKARWIRIIRPIRLELRELRDSGQLDRSTYRHYYRRAKGGAFRSRAHLLLHLDLEGQRRKVAAQALPEGEKAPAAPEAKTAPAPAQAPVQPAVKKVVPKKKGGKTPASKPSVAKQAKKVKRPRLKEG